MIIKFLEPDFTFSNEAGSLRQLIHEGWRQVNVVTSVAGAVRGGHFHVRNHEMFYVVSGRFKLHVSLHDENETHVMTPGTLFVIPPFAAHTFEYLEDTVLVVLYDNGVELSDGTKDIVPMEGLD